MRAGKAKPPESREIVAATGGTAWLRLALSRVHAHAQQRDRERAKDAQSNAYEGIPAKIDGSKQHNDGPGEGRRLQNPEHDFALQPFGHPSLPLVRLQFSDRAPMSLRLDFRG
jgi:hypothetical protein